MHWHDVAQDAGYVAWKGSYQRLGDSSLQVNQPSAPYLTPVASDPFFQEETEGLVRKGAERKVPEFFGFLSEFCSEFSPNFFRTSRAFQGRVNHEVHIVN